MWVSVFGVDEINSHLKVLRCLTNRVSSVIKNYLTTHRPSYLSTSFIYVNLIYFVPPLKSESSVHHLIMTRRLSNKRWSLTHLYVKELLIRNPYPIDLPRLPTYLYHPFYDS